MKQYLSIVKDILDNGEVKVNRTGVDAISIAGAMFKHKMQDGFPLLTTKKMALRLVASELEFFIKGMTDKQWLIDNNNHIWDEWANPKKVPYSHDEATKKKMLAERDLGFQVRFLVQQMQRLHGLTTEGHMRRLLFPKYLVDLSQNLRQRGSQTQGDLGC